MATKIAVDNKRHDGSADGIMEILHVIPMADDREHEVNCKCWCCPRPDPTYGENVMVHRSADGREAFETGERLMS